MAKYGIPYQGSKSGIADSLITVLPKGKRFVDLFGGGFAMTECAIKSNKYDSFLYNEINPLLPVLIKKAINGDYGYDRFKPEFITREKFNDLKDEDGYIAYIWSFGNNPEKRYMFAKELEPKKKSLHNFIVFGTKDEFINQEFNDIDKHIKPENKDIRARRLLLSRYMNTKKKKFANSSNALNICEQLERLEHLQQLERLEHLQQLGQLEHLQQLGQLEIICGDYLDYKYREGDVVYCDPPYENTASYKGGFDIKQFYGWAASRDYPVYFSSYKISDPRFKMIWAKGKRGLMNSASGARLNYECLYINQ